MLVSKCFHPMSAVIGAEVIIAVELVNKLLLLACQHTFIEQLHVKSA
jgi:hypothetical protein